MKRKRTALQKRKRLAAKDRESRKTLPERLWTNLLLAEQIMATWTERR